MKYLLPCECGNQVPIDSSQAGQLVDCDCGAQLEAPSLREMRSLERRQEPSAFPHPQAGTRGAQPGTRWSAGQGALFVVGVIVMLISGATLGSFAYQRAQLPQLAPPAIDTTASDEAIDQMTPVEVFELWNEISSRELERPGQPAHLYFREARERLATRMLISAGVLAAALAMIVASFVIGH